LSSEHLLITLPVAGGVARRAGVGVTREGWPKAGVGVTREGWPKAGVGHRGMRASYGANSSSVNDPGS
ncbi:MAG: hypothetical protein JWQ02_4146, partial [Capsulimonas sp.]|nr:hypothetical protein [Capsulimonas sp.]